MGTVPEHGVVKDLFDVDVKDLLVKRRLVIEKEALDCLLVAHMYDLGLKMSLDYARLQEKDDIVHAMGALEFSGRGLVLGSGKTISLLNDAEEAEEEELLDEDDELEEEALMMEDGLEADEGDRVHETGRT